ncbi:unnamed protein product [Microthlaspi erraticum]|uniref:Uncharacterized protein n=1 Tax=Microthlaspi erraticum TaxID=1685480 RepID=A0A6D2KWD4_9BRAS|nr:unnamed protein product [Microthlaspi erraticum]
MALKKTTTGNNYTAPRSDGSTAEFAELRSLLTAMQENTQATIQASIHAMGEINFEVNDLSTLKMSEVSFHWVMGLLACQMASAYFFSHMVLAYHNGIGTAARIFEEMTMFCGFLSLFFTLIHLYGLWGIAYLPVSPPISLTGLQLARSSCLNLKSSTIGPESHEESLKKRV